MVASSVPHFLDSALLTARPKSVSLMEVVSRVFSHDKFAHFRNLRLEGTLRVILDLLLKSLPEKFSSLLLRFVLVDLLLRTGARDPNVLATHS